MNDSMFKTWLTNRDRYDQTTADAAKDHMASCEFCKTLYRFDALLEGRIVKGLVEVGPPAGLFSRIKGNIQFEVSSHIQNTRIFLWKRLATALAMVAVIVVIVFQPYSGQIKSFDQIGTFALAEHLTSKLEMTFNARDVSDVTGWFSERLGFNIEIPGLEMQGFQFLGGRECFFGKKKAAYLYYQKTARKASLFIINHDDLGFEMKPERSYAVYEREHIVRIWKADKLVYAMIE